MELTPIEVKMYAALKQLEADGKTLHLAISPQHHILTYRVDFCIHGHFIKKTGDIGLIKIIIECDGHDFHEKTKDQAARDKKRDRDLHKLGFIVLRFSGSEIYRSMMSCFKDILDLLVSISGER